MATKRPSKRLPKYALNRIEKLRKSRGWSLAFLAAKIGTTDSQIHKLEKSQVKLTDDWAKRLANVFHCRWYELFEDAPEPSMDSDTQRMVEVYTLLAEDDRRAVFRHADSLSKPHTGHDPKNGTS